MKKLILLKSLVACSTISLPLVSITSCFEKPAIEGIEISGDKEVMFGKQVTYTATLNITGGELDKTVEWSIAESSVSSTIDKQTGVLTAGSVVENITIVATSIADNSKTASYSVSIISPIKSINITGEESLPWGNKTYEYTANVEVSEGYNPSVTWSIVEQEHESQIDPSLGKLTTGSIAEDITIKATSKADPNSSSTMLVHVVSPVKNITIGGEETLPWNDSTHKYTATIDVFEGCDQTVTWSIVESGKTSTIDHSTGDFTAGPVTEDVTIKATPVADPNSSATMLVHVVSPVKNITIGGEETLPWGESSSYTADVQVFEGCDQTVTWSIVEAEHESQIDSSSGELTTGSKAENITIKATPMADPSSAATISVHVVSPIKSISISGKNKIDWEQTSQYTAKVETFEGYANTVTWSIVEQEHGAQINATTGELTSGKKTEDVTIKATSTVDSTVSATFKVHVNSPIIEIKITMADQIFVNQTTMVYAQVTAKEGFVLTGVTLTFDGDDHGCTVVTGDDPFRPFVRTSSETGLLTVHITSNDDPTAFATYKTSIVPEP